MDIGLLKKIFGADQQWQGACTIILDADANVYTAGTDAIGTGGLKVFAPRIISGRVLAEAACLLKDNTAIVLFQQQRTKTATGEEVVRHTLTMVDPRHIVAVEFTEGVPQALQAVGLTIPVGLKPGGSHSGVHAKPKTIS